VIELASVYIMVKLIAGKDEEVFAQVQKLKQIKEASVTYGAYDLILKVEFQRIEEVDEFLFDVVRRIPGVSETMSMIVAKKIV
jgi:DNA-binding Lrp family transcriptional regulator